MNAAYWMLVALAVLAIAYRYYSAFIAARVLCLDDARVTPAHLQNDGHNFHPTNRWVLFGHHFAAITGAGPLIGPVLAAQFGFYPGFLWILFGVVLGGAVHDFVILVSSTRRNGRSLAEIARDELGPVRSREVRDPEDGGRRELHQEPAEPSVHAAGALAEAAVGRLHELHRDQHDRRDRERDQKDGVEDRVVGVPAEQKGVEHSERDQ